MNLTCEVFFTLRGEVELLFFFSLVFCHGGIIEDAVWARGLQAVNEAVGAGSLCLAPLAVQGASHGINLYGPTENFWMR